MEALTCMNCKQPVGENEAKFFHGTFVCGTCFTIAERFYSRAHKELNDLLVMLKEGLRLAIIDGRLQFKEGSGVELSKREVLEAIVQLQEMNDARKTRSMASGSSVAPVAEQGPHEPGSGHRHGPVGTNTVVRKG